MRIAIVGAGPTGLAGSLALKDFNCEVDIFEKDASVGGMMRSGVYLGNSYDHGSFIFGPSEEKWLFDALRPDLFAPAEAQLALAWVDGQLENYPHPQSIIWEKLTTKERVSALFTIPIRRIFAQISEPDNLKDWLMARVGSGVARLLYLNILLNKLYKLPLSEVSPVLSKFRLNEFETKQVLYHLFQRLIPKKPRISGFLKYPIQGGVGGVMKELWDDAVACGVNLHLNTKVEMVAQKDRSVNIRLSGVEKPLNYDGVLLTTFIDGLSKANLFWCDLLVTVRVYQGGIPLKNVFRIYNFTPGSLWRRMINFTALRRSNSPSGEYCVAFETTFPEGETPPTERISAEISRDYANLLGNKSPGKLIGEKNIIVRKAYPIYRKGCEREMKRYLQEASDTRIILCGRNGTFSYFPSRHAMNDGARGAYTLLSRLGMNT